MNLIILAAERDGLELELKAAAFLADCIARDKAKLQAENAMLREAIEKRLKQDRATSWNRCLDCDYPNQCSAEVGCKSVLPCSILSAALAKESKP